MPVPARCTQSTCWAYSSECGPQPPNSTSARRSGGGGSAPASMTSMSGTAAFIASAAFGPSWLMTRTLIWAPGRRRKLRLLRRRSAKPPSPRAKPTSEGAGHCPGRAEAVQGERVQVADAAAHHDQHGAALDPQRDLAVVGLIALRPDPE